MFPGKAAASLASLLRKALIQKDQFQAAKSALRQALQGPQGLLGLLRVTLHRQDQFHGTADWKQQPS